MRVGVYGLALIVAIGPSIPRGSGACSYPLRHGWDFGDTPTIENDRTPPTLAMTSRVERYGGGACADCPGMGYVVFTPTATDDRTPVDFIRYRFEIVRGTPPFEFIYDTYGVDYDRIIGMMFDVDADDFSFDVKVTAVDISGNESPPVVLKIEG